MLTADQNIFYQQNNALRKVSLVVFDTNDRAILRLHAQTILDALTRCKPGSYELLEMRGLK